MLSRENVNKFLLALVILSLPVASVHAARRLEAYDLKTKALGDDVFRMSAEYANFVSKGLYDTKGIESEQTGSFSQSDLMVNMGYGWGNYLDFYIGGRARSNQSTHLDNGVSYTNTIKGFESATLGFRYDLGTLGAKKRWRSSIEAQVRATLYKNKNYAAGSIPTNEVALGDSGQEALVMANLSYELSQYVYLEAGLGYRMPGNSLSQEVIYRGAAALVWKKFSLYGGVNGVRSMGFDEYSDKESQKPAQATASTHLYNSINRSYMEPFLGAGLVMGQFRLDIEGYNRMNGVSTDKGSGIVLCLSYQSGGKNASEVKKDQFKEYFVDATVLKVSPRGTFVKIDQGATSDIVTGMEFDLYETDYFGGNKLVASGVAYEVGADSTIVKLTKKIGNIEVKKGFSARGH